MNNPVLVGALTVLVTVVAVFISYNANSGLPFVPTYELNVRLHDGSGLQSGRDVRIGGTRVGSVEEVKAVVKKGRVSAVAKLQLENRFGPMKSDTVVAARPLSALGLKYVDLVPGKRGKTLRSGSTLSLGQARRSVELAATLGSFESGTRNVGEGKKGLGPELSRRGTGLIGLGTALAGPVAALAGVAPASAELGIGFAGRGPTFNRTLERIPSLLRRAELVSANLADPRTGLRRFLRGAGLTAAELALARAELGRGIDAGDVTLRALAAERPALEEGISELPPTESAGLSALREARPLLDDATVFIRDIRPGLRVLRPASVDLHRAIRRGIPVLRRTPPLARRLTTALVAVRGLARDPATTRTLRKLRAAVLSLEPTLRFVVPAQARCNYLALAMRNAASAVSEGDNSGNWLRFVPILAADEMLQQAEPVENLHVNPYANTGAPSQGGECEAGREPYLPGRRIGHVPGFQGGSTESTNPRSVVPPPE